MSESDKWAARWSRWRQPAVKRLEGLLAIQKPDEDRIYERAIEQYDEACAVERVRASQRIVVERGPFCIVFLSDQHLGSSGVDYRRVFRDAEIVRDTPGMYAAIHGDVVDQFILKKMQHVRFQSRLTVSDEWVLMRRYLKILSKKLLLVVRGNHDSWIERVTGIDYFREVVAEIHPEVIYGRYGSRVVVQMDGYKWPMKVRHKWKGSSIYNPTHGIERAAKWEKDFVLGVGGHTHECGVARDFVVGARDCLAVLTGSYKRIDDFSDQCGYPKPNYSAAVAVIFDSRNGGSMVGCRSLDVAVDMMKGLYGRRG